MFPPTLASTARMRYSAAMPQEPKRKPPLQESAFIQIGVKILLVFAIIWVGSHVAFVFRPVVALVTAVFLPVLAAGVLFYLTQPFVRLVERSGLPRGLGIALLYVLIAVLLASIALVVGPLVQAQVEQLIASMPGLVRAVRSLVETVQEHPAFGAIVPDDLDLDLDLGRAMANVAGEAYRIIERNLDALAGFVGNIALILGTVPFVLFFMLKDGERLPGAIVRFLPGEYRAEGSEVLRRMSDALAAYIQGQILVSLFVGSCMLAGYLVLGIDYPLLLAIISLVTNLIPYFGPVIGAVPGVVVALLDSPAAMFQVLVLILIVQQLESQLISPLVMGRKLRIHPVTVIFALLTGGSLAGFFGLLLAVPTYAVVRTAAVHLYKLYQLKMRTDRRIVAP